MSDRPIGLRRHEAEMLVELIEAHATDDLLMMELASAIRQQWGMSPRGEP